MTIMSPELRTTATRLGYSNWPSRLPHSPNWNLKRPSLSKIWIRWLLVSATTMSFWALTATPEGSVNWPSSTPNSPNLQWYTIFCRLIWDLGGKPPLRDVTPFWGGPPGGPPRLAGVWPPRVEDEIVEGWPSVNNLLDSSKMLSLVCWSKSLSDPLDHFS